MTEQKPTDDDRVAAFLRALDQLPAYLGISYRGRPSSATFGSGHPTLVTQLITASSLDLGVATDRLSTPGVFAILGQTGRDVSAFSAERRDQEIVFAPGTVLWAGETIPIAAGFEMTLVWELLERDGAWRAFSDDPTEVTGTLRTAATEAYEAGPGERGSSSDRFVGDIE